MKKNLFALAALLVLVAVAARFIRHGGRNAEWVALENDMVASLEALWEQPGQKVELMESEGGARVLATVAMPPQGDLTWNEPFLRFVAARHPAVSLQAIEIRGPFGMEGDLAHHERVRRQQQAWVDRLLGPGKGLMLLQFREVVAQQQLAPPAASPTTTQLFACLVLLAEPPRGQLTQVFQGLNTAQEQRGEHRVFKLPTP
ncbi:MAG: hypothetical protein J0I12_33900 [Candidatus Eremiobacteraeota bacterium]|nr:hypothetical protein [Candidatus Eremiobacteraeota bacterium]